MENLQNKNLKTQKNRNKLKKILPNCNTFLESFSLHEKQTLEFQQIQQTVLDMQKFCSNNGGFNNRDKFMYENFARLYKSQPNEIFYCCIGQAHLLGAKGIRGLITQNLGFDKVFTSKIVYRNCKNLLGSKIPAYNKELKQSSRISIFTNTKSYINSYILVNCLENE